MGNEINSLSNRDQGRPDMTRIRPLTPGARTPGDDEVLLSTEVPYAIPIWFSSIRVSRRQFHLHTFSALIGGASLTVPEATPFVFAACAVLSTVGHFYIRRAERLDELAKRLIVRNEQLLEANENLSESHLAEENRRLHVLLDELHHEAKSQRTLPPPSQS